MALFTRRFISAGFGISDFKKYYPAPYMRKKLFLTEKPEKARLLFSGLGYYRLFVNGPEITRGHLSPYTSNTDKLVYFDEYDLSERLSVGENVIAFILGNGMRTPLGNVYLAESRFVGEPCAAFVLDLTRKDGSVDRIEADDSVKVHTSPILFNDLRIGEKYDARLEKETAGWLEPGYDDSLWENAKRCEMPRGDHRIAQDPPIKVRRTLKPVSIEKEGDGFIYDFGRNGAGLVSIHGDFEPGRRLLLEFSELLSDGKLFTFPLRILDPSVGLGYTHQTVDYTCAGDSFDYTPSFTYEGCRYIKITGVNDSEATEDLLTFDHMSSAVEERGTFSCSDPVLNKLQSITREATLSNMFHIPTDCPHREKHGWTADAAVSSVHMLMNLDCDDFLTEWMNNVALAQNAEGAMPGTVPSATDWGFDSWNGPAWDSVLTEIPYRLWEIRGDLRAASAVRQAMIRYITYILGRRNENGLVAFGLGDWVAPHEIIKAPLELTDTVMCYDFCNKAAALYRVLGDRELAEFCLNTARSFRDAVREQLIDHENALAAGNCQTSQAMCIYYNIFTEEEKARAANKLVEIIKRDGEYIDTGVLGVRVIFRVLADHGHADLAHFMIRRPDGPSYGNMVKRGDTTLAEDFLTEDERINSRNHHFLGDISAWFMSYICGIRVNPRAEGDLRRAIDGLPLNVPEDGYDNINVLPTVPTKIDFAEASYKAPGGEIAVRLDRNTGRDSIVMKITVKGRLYGEVFPPLGYGFIGSESFPLTHGENVYEAFPTNVDQEVL
ncbi:MAG: family 78 glycoside hydrolase catalytic domain [Clostridia bacterium]|nr:family 78 glycoside hydrolase catalytic domain [Clostridia bacterium]